ncbi:hypothetical protein C7999DRAFT_34050 [Corynascus novoguineensis]|uniref:FAD-binding PCMH-type domain-containing protein n=1 Tax=Corynascus novoguineensis TaxID=1126955 RepID=A0AAN7CQI9_9PEZI|nr:hypothetical protein C7999DRAFT_34050 [Corynascus novoguineensis]
MRLTFLLFVTAPLVLGGREVGNRQEGPNETQLTVKDIGDFADVSFGNLKRSVSATRPRCKSFPGDPSWPRASEWARLNKTLEGALLQPLPPASVCYRTSPNFNTEACDFLLRNASRTSFYLDDPLTILTQWPQGNTCLLSQDPAGNCTQGGFPIYVVNATSVKHVQAAVNFARNKNVRLVVKNTGHDSSGRSTGAGALSVWTHYLKGFEFLPEYKQPGGNYHGPAARAGAGLQVWEAFRHAEQYNITLPAASCLTVGSYGGWITGGGHSPLSSKFGLGVDQVLSLQVVTADGRYVTANPKTNEDLFFALRGGGGSTYGIVTSAIVKAHPQINLTIASFSFTLGSTTSTTPGPSVTVSDAETFWKGFNEVFAFGIPTVDAGGYLWTNGNPARGSTNYQMQVQVQMPGLTPAETADFVQPLLRTLNTLGIPVAIATPTTRVYSSQAGSTGGAPGNGYFASRLFPRAVFENATLFSAAMSAARATVEAGYVFHGLNMAPTLRAAGHPTARAGVNPVWREAVMHADVFTGVNMGTLTPAEGREAQRRLDGYMTALRAATPGGGAYFNEADVLEPDWQRSFFGSNYGALAWVKRSRDPWHVFWSPTTPGSEAWAVEKAPGDELPTQNGRLCRV